MKLNLRKREDREAAKVLLKKYSKILKDGGRIEITMKDSSGNVKSNKIIEGDFQSE